MQSREGRGLKVTRDQVEVTLPASAIDLGKEASDRLQKHTIILHLVAVMLSPAVKAVHFSTRFYHFEPLKTIPAQVLPPIVEEGTAAAAGGPSMLKVDGAELQHGVTISFSVDALEHCQGAGAAQDLHFARSEKKMRAGRSGGEGERTEGGRRTGAECGRRDG